MNPNFRWKNTLFVSLSAITVIGLDASSSPLTDVMLTKQDLNELEWYYKTGKWS